MKFKLLLATVLVCLMSMPAQAKKILIDEVTVPIKGYMNYEEDRVIYLSPYGEFTVTLDYWDTFSHPNNNNYAVTFRGYKDNTKDFNSSIFNSHLSGRSQNEVNRNSWGGTTYFERTNYDGMEHIIWLSNGTWSTRFSIFENGTIVVSYGRFTDAGTLDAKQSILLVGGKDTWNKLVKILRKAHSFNIGKTK